jgi:hypothetical protein
MNDMWPIQSPTFSSFKIKNGEQGLIFIPDISGFTQFVNQMEIDHSRLIIQELLEVLMNANEIGLSVSEVEGDAILFYKLGGPPEMQDLYKQVEKMFCDFHRQLNSYDHRRFCQCKTCQSVINLSLKVITHYGEFKDYQVKNFNQLFGKDVIVAHQLLKNDIEQHEYWLVTHSLMDKPPSSLPSWMNWDSSKQQTGSGEIDFQYAQLGHLKKEIPPDHFPLLALSKKKKVITIKKDYDVHIIALFHATGDFTYRSRWQEGVKEVIELNHFLPRLGMRGKCIMENGEESIYASSYSFQPDRIEFSETEEKEGNTSYYTLEKTGESKARLTLDNYIGKNPLKQVLFSLGKKKKMESTFQRSLSNLEKVVKDIKLPDNEFML